MLARVTAGAQFRAAHYPNHARYPFYTGSIFR